MGGRRRKQRRLVKNFLGEAQGAALLLLAARLYLREEAQGGDGNGTRKKPH